ncbi:MAG TPA: lipopolysaccharide assembly protein LapA domain-containing protein [Pilimelia sp.]|nr:lipopolysaccharide assembly protein LapA domain-containing protein [Pilimelia sp.]
MSQPHPTGAPVPEPDHPDHPDGTDRTDRPDQPRRAGEPGRGPGADDAGPAERYGLGAAVNRAPAVPRTRAGAAWVGSCAAAVVFLALIIFIAQNTANTQIAFLGLEGTLPLAAALLAAALAGAVLTLVIGTTRITQLRRLARGRRH